MTATTGEIIEVEVPERFNVASAFVDRIVSEGGGGRTALICEDARLSYAELQALQDRAAGALAALGVELEQRVALLLLDSPEFIACFWGAIKLGAVPIPFNTLLKPVDHLFLLNDSRARVLVVHRALWDALAPLREEMRYLRHVVIVGDPADGCENWEGLLAEATPRSTAEDVSKDDAAFWLYTSGSTGFPKGAVHLQHDLMHCVQLYGRNVLGLRADDVVLSAAKLFFAYGLGNALYLPQDVGATVVLHPGRPLPKAMFSLMKRHNVTHFFGVPTLYAQMLEFVGDDPRWNIPSVRLCVSAGESLPADIYRRWRERFGVEILDGIGTTEIGHIFISNRAGEARPGSTGRIVPGYEARLVDDAGADVPRGEIGALMVKGDSTLASYWNRHEQTKTSILGAWMLTGDKYYQDEDGYFWYCGRNDDMLKVGGIWVSPAEVEATLSGHEAVLEAAVVGQEDDEQLVKPKAYVVLRAGREPSPALATELQEYVKRTIAPFKYPRWVEFLPELPKTATGKIQRYKLREERRE